MSAEERSAWRDEALSRRHRRWGLNCPAVDVDFLLIEYDKSQPVAIVDYKHASNTSWTGDTANLSALGNLCGTDGSQLPFFVTEYIPESWRFSIKPMNSAGLDLASDLAMPSGWISERDWVRYLYVLRERQPPNIPGLLD